MKRYDGRLLKSISPFTKLIPHVMTKRSDAQVFSKQIIRTEPIDAYIKEKRAQGLDISYLHLFIAVFVRVIAQRPQLNRFVMDRRLYARNRIWISLAIKRSLHDEGEETTIKFEFKGTESIYEVKAIVDKLIGESIAPGSQNSADKIADRIMSLPNFIVKLLVDTLKVLDHYNLLPKAIIELSPFHTSVFFTYLKSINLDYIYHHLYDFGTTGVFAALGKTKKMPIAQDELPVIKKCCEIGYVLDERICDGVYFSNSFKLYKKYLSEPHLLEEPLLQVTQDVE
jgi:hypothetical protein